MPFSCLREPFSSGSHLSGALAGVFGMVYLLSCSDGTFGSIAAVLVYSLALIALFSISGLLHGIHCSEATLKKLEDIDYAAIYFFIAGTYTPICFFAVQGTMGFGLLIGEWLLALLGIWLTLTRGPSGRNIQVCIFLAMGWAFVIVLPSLSNTLSPLAFELLILGGVLYSVGSIVFALDWLCLFGTRFSAHDLWHVMVLLGSASHYALVVQVVS